MIFMTKQIIVIYKLKKKKIYLKNDKEVKKVRQTFLDRCISLHWELIYNNTSKISGKEGNSEELFYFIKKEDINEK